MRRKILASAAILAVLAGSLVAWAAPPALPIYVDIQKPQREFTLRFAGGTTPRVRVFTLDNAVGWTNLYHYTGTFFYTDSPTSSWVVAQSSTNVSTTGDTGYIDFDFAATNTATSGVFWAQIVMYAPDGGIFQWGPGELTLDPSPGTMGAGLAVLGGVYLRLDGSTRMGGGLLMGTNDLTETGHILPGGSNLYDLGSSTNPFREAWVGTGSLHIGTETVDVARLETWDAGGSATTDVAGLVTTQVLHTTQISGIHSTQATHTTEIAGIVSTQVTQTAEIAGLQSTQITHTADIATRVSTSDVRNVSLSGDVSFFPTNGVATSGRVDVITDVGLGDPVLEVTVYSTLERAQAWRGGSAGVLIGKMGPSAAADRNAGALELLSNGLTRTHLSAGQEDSYFNTGHGVAIGKTSADGMLDVVGEVQIEGLGAITTNLLVRYTNAQDAVIVTTYSTGEAFLRIYNQAGAPMIQLSAGDDPTLSPSTIGNHLNLLGDLDASSGADFAGIVTALQFVATEGFSNVVASLPAEFRTNALAAQGTTNTIYQQGLRLSATPDVTGWFELSCAFYNKGDPGADLVAFQVEQDDAVWRAGHTNSILNFTSWTPWDYSPQMYLTNGQAYTFDLDYKIHIRAGANTQSIYQATMALTYINEK